MDIRERLEQMIQTGYEIQIEEREIEAMIYDLSINAAEAPEDLIRQEVVTKKKAWINKLRILTGRYLGDSPLIDRLIYALNVADLSDLIGLLEAIYDDDEFFNDSMLFYVESHDLQIDEVKEEYASDSNSKKVFIVHGHDDGAKEKVARLVETLKLEAIILHEQPNMGKTIMEKFKEYTDVVGYAIVIYTSCDVGKAINEEDLHNRARQNVVFEHGYLIAKLGSGHVCALVKGDIEIPSDLHGVLYVSMDESDAWKYRLVEELKAAGFIVSKDDLP
ncbi:MAG: nucleotide-binding protein [Coriobacteriia bacterium]|nr:nucleotide-binding protein [Coriobacteriia bacterium]